MEPLSLAWRARSTMLTGVNYLLEGDIHTALSFAFPPAMLYTAVAPAWAVITGALLTYPVGITFTDTTAICSHLRKNLESWHGGDNECPFTVSFSTWVWGPGQCSGLQDWPGLPPQVGLV